MNGTVLLICGDLPLRKLLTHSFRCFMSCTIWGICRRRSFGPGPFWPHISCWHTTFWFSVVRFNSELQTDALSGNCTVSIMHVYNIIIRPLIHRGRIQRSLLPARIYASAGKNDKFIHKIGHNTACNGDNM